ncbi:TonB-linked SusC/RagA family outer membrane protein [Lewinella marina]|uniref:SusC/RagA family TonB-linked outer membrane protein n=1 Tax=Neolewinella marina TaxID=438751 RepID=A0A2G0CKF1_9BACT|nr:SusC/RagA family TonB-linked outer membrane protein [Neolewinella marina]NJB84356.1 TonB-linked SusC/RagA family outer membrane protein [Neolewinella marina]PHL00445.1 SusC/RagA family TonB-linked outer membrane protein [Neolewinella marina]
MLNTHQGAANSRLFPPPLWLLLVAFLCSTSGLLAQTISGQVLDNEDGLPLIGATVAEQGTTNGTVSDIDGNFTLNLTKLPAVIQVSYIGYSSREVRLEEAQSDLVFRLSEGANLDEVVVTALGIERSTKNITYAVQELDGDQLRTTRDPNFANTLNGKVAGLVVTTGAGGPGGAARIVLRGNRSISGSNNALVVVDGVPIDNSTRGQVGNDFGGYNNIDGVSNINPYDIESVSFLKGGAAAALYGSRGANGVMLITTKSGSEGRVQVNVNSGVSFETPSLLPEFQNTYGQGNGGTSNETAAGSWGGETTTYPDNVENFFRTGVSLDNSISLSGGTATTQAYFSYTNNRNQGIIPNNELNRNTFNLRLQQSLGSKLHGDFKATIVDQSIDNKVKVGEESGIVQNLYKIPRSVDLADYENFEDEDGNPRYWTTSSIYTNPYWTLNRTPNDDNRDRRMFLGSLTYDLTEKIKVTGRASLDRSNDLLTFRIYDRTLLFAGPGGTYQEGSGFFQENNFDLFLNGYQDVNEDFRVDFLVGTALNQRESKYTFINANGLLVPNKFSTDFGINVSTNSSVSQREYQSVFGTASVTFRNFLVLDASARNDWSSTLPAPHSFFYPSAGLSLIVSDMVRLPDFFSFAKLRGTLSEVGNDADPYRLLNTYSVQQGGTNGFIAQDATRNIPDLKPEITRSLEFGADVRMLRGRLGVDLTWYKTNSFNQLFLVPLPAPTGFSNQYINAGNVQNKGVELTIQARVVEKENFGYISTVNFARNVNDIIELSDKTKRVFLGGGFGRTAGPLVEEGGRYGDLYGEGWARDEQGRFLVDDMGLPIGSGGGETLLGNFNPDFTLGWNNKFDFLGFNVSLLIDGRFGGVMVSGTDANLAFDGTADYTTAFRDGGLVLPGVTEDGTPNNTAVSAEQFWTRVSGGRYSFGEFFTYDATNVRIREFSIGYGIPVPQSLGIRTARLSLTARNLLFLYRGKAILDIPGIPERTMNFDPDIQLGAGNYQGVEYGNLPSTRTIGFNLQLGF